MSVNKVPAKYLVSINMNGLEGRMLRYPLNNSSNDILFVGDLRSNIEYWWGLARALHDFATVTIPDLPGIGGMDSFYHINVRPSINNYADYLATFIKMRYKHKKFVCIGAGFGFVVITRMLQKHPDLKRNIKLLVSFGGFADHDDFVLSKRQYFLSLYATALFSRRLPSFILKFIVSREVVWRRISSRSLPGSIPSKEKQKLIDVEVERWLSGDLRTYLVISNELAWFTNCKVPIELDVWHVGLRSSYLNWRRVLRHMNQVFANCHYLSSSKATNNYSLLRSKKSAAVFLPTNIKRQIKLACD